VDAPSVEKIWTIRSPRPVALVVALVGVFSAASTLRAIELDDAPYALRFATRTLTAPAGESRGAAVRCVLEPNGARRGEGVEAWSIAFTVEGATVTSIAATGVAAAAASSGGFARSEAVRAAGIEGAVSDVVLSFAEAITLPVDAATEIASAGVAVVADEAVCDPRDALPRSRSSHGCIRSIARRTRGTLPVRSIPPLRTAAFSS